MDSHSACDDLLVPGSFFDNLPCILLAKNLSKREIMNTFIKILKNSGTLSHLILEKLQL